MVLGAMCRRTERWIFPEAKQRGAGDVHAIGVCTTARPQLVVPGAAVHTRRIASQAVTLAASGARFPETVTTLLALEVRGTGQYDSRLVGFSRALSINALSRRAARDCRARRPRVRRRGGATLAIAEAIARPTYPRRAKYSSSTSFIPVVGSCFTPTPCLIISRATSAPSIRAIGRGMPRTNSRAPRVKP